MTENRTQVKKNPRSAICNPAPWHPPAPAGGGSTPRSSRGFTLIELMIVLALIGTLAALALPDLTRSIIRAREAVLREDLFQMRDAIDQYYTDKGKYPDTLKDLVTTQEGGKSYLRDVPRDPFTHADDWIIVAPESGEEGGVFDVHSASTLLATDDTAYNTW